MSDPYVLVVPADDPLAQRASASLADLGGLPADRRRTTCSSGLVVEHALAGHGFEIEYAFRSDDNSTCRVSSPPGSAWRSMPLLAVSPRRRPVKAAPRSTRRSRAA